MLAILTALCLGFVWMLVLGLQTRLLLLDRPRVVALWTFGASLLWAGVVSKLAAAGPDEVLCYALGSALGAVCAQQLGRPR